MLVLNNIVLMSGADYFDNGFAINAHMDAKAPVNVLGAKAEHKAIQDAMETAGIKVIKVDPPKDCQDGIYTANWALCIGSTAVMARLPNKRKGEEPYAEMVLKQLGKEIIHVPGKLRFSGQGDALPCGNDLFMGSKYRTDPEVHAFIQKTTGLHVISLQTIPLRTMHGKGRQIINPTTGWPDSFYYDIDLALSVLRAPSDGQKGLIAYCPTAFTRKSRNFLKKYDGVEKIVVSRKEATTGFACNLVSTGETVIMSAKAPKLKKKLLKRGFKVITPKVSEIAKGGGYIRCTTLTLS